MHVNRKTIMVFHKLQARISGYPKPTDRSKTQKLSYSIFIKKKKKKKKKKGRRERERGEKFFSNKIKDGKNTQPYFNKNADTGTEITARNLRIVKSRREPARFNASVLVFTRGKMNVLIASVLNYKGRGSFMITLYAATRRQNK